MTPADELRAEARACLASPRLPFEFRLLYALTLASPVAGALAWHVHDFFAFWTWKISRELRRAFWGQG